MLDFGALLDKRHGAMAEPPTDFLTLDEVKEILDDLDFHTVVIEGQEAGLDPAYAAFTEMLHRRYGARVTLVTNACKLPALSFTDTIEVGIKSLDDRLHIDYTGISNRSSLENFDRLVEAGKKLVVDTVLIPGYINADEVESIAAHVASRDPNIPFILLPYFPTGSNPWRRPTAAEMDAAADRAKKHLSRVFCFRGDETLKYPIYNVFPAAACPQSGTDGDKWLTRVAGLNRRPDSVLDEIQEIEGVAVQ
jgi:pyruvate-formate lyase-activating enzyme